MAKYIIMPKLGFNMDQGTIVRWLKEEGDTVKEREEILEIETDKTIMPVEAPCPGILRKILVGVGETIAVALPIGIIAEEKEDIQPLIEEAARRLEKKDQPITSPKEEETNEKVVVLAKTHSTLDEKVSPRAQRKAKELGVDLAQMKQDLKVKTIREKDVINYYQKQQDTPTKMKGLTSIPYIGIRKIIGDRLSQSKFTAPHLYFTCSVDMTLAQQLLTKLRGRIYEKITINDLILLVTAKVLKEQPKLNCSLLNGNIVYYHRINLGLAVALEEGLMVPVLKDADNKNLRELSQEAHRLIQLAQERKLAPEDYQGGTFTVSNLGMYGIEQFTAIINPPEAAILSIGEIKRIPTVIETNGKEEIAVRSIMKVTISVDHRLIDGIVAAKFLKDIRKYLEFPEKFIL
ncbi:2-oxo acid dehydrogenase subunit E2 [Candidatus Atribacteria bacterium HGW-Atribacteria-1]|nr:MAG: 2-oxo acid dehydrogenase subunit E2 [Candidatus Atribacteria bacterium HGW-Atribacteria-1]